MRSMPRPEKKAAISWRRRFFVLITDHRGDIALLGVLNGTLVAREVKTGNFFWEYQTETSKANKGWLLTADRKFNGPMLYSSSWRAAPMVATDRQFNVGAIFSTPLVVNGVVYFGSIDGFLCALK